MPSEKRCTRCGVTKSVSEFYRSSYGQCGSRCKKCEVERLHAYDRNTPGAKAKRVTKFNNKKRDEAIAAFLAAQEANKEAKPMSEADWIETCTFFGGCAICGSESIESREFFVKFQAGGKYTVGNMLPLCASCQERFIRYQNPFILLSRALMQHSGKEVVDQVRAAKIIKYLEGKLCMKE